MITQYSDEAPEYIAAVKKLWDWADKQTDLAVKTRICGIGHEPIAVAVGTCAAYKTVRREMRTLFAGLIDFDE